MFFNNMFVSNTATTSNADENFALGVALLVECGRLFCFVIFSQQQVSAERCVRDCGAGVGAVRRNHGSAGVAKVDRQHIPPTRKDHSRWPRPSPPRRGAVKTPQISQRSKSSATS